MNKDRRKRLRQITDQAGQMLEQLRAIREEEQDAVDNFPEGLQNTERYWQMVTTAEFLSDAADSLEDIIESLEDML